jgi:putative copper export protein
MFEFVHFLHIASGIVWAGGAVAFILVVEPALLRLEPGEMRGFLAAQAKFAGAVMGISGVLLLLTGFARAFMGGGVASFGDLFTTSYGLHVLVAFVLVVAVTALGGRRRALTARLLTEEGDPREKLRASYRSFALLSTGGIMATIAIMAILGLGLY